MGNRALGVSLLQLKGPGGFVVEVVGALGVSLLKLKGRGDAVVEVEGARAGRAAVVGAWRWFEVNGVTPNPNKTCSKRDPPLYRPI